MDEPHFVLIQNVNLIDMMTGKTQKHMDVEIENSKIIKIEPTGQIQIKDSYDPIDGSDLFLCPSLIDCHMHVSYEDELLQFLANGVTTVRNMWGTEQIDSWASEIQRNERLGPEIFSSSPIIDGESPMWEGSFVCKSEADADEITELTLQNNYIGFKILNYLSAQAYGWLVERSQQHEIDIFGHTPIEVGLSGILENGQYCIEHLDGYLEEIQADYSPYEQIPPRERNKRRAVMYQHIDDTKIPEIVKKTVNAATWNCATLTVIFRTYGEDITELMQKYKKTIPKNILEKHKQTLETIRTRVTASELSTIAENLEVNYKILKHLHDEGGNIAIGTDTGNPFIFAGYSLHEELEHHIQAGFSAYDALKGVTINAARFLRQDHRIGSIEVGKDANLLLVEGNPLDDIQHLRDIDHLFVQGTPYNKSVLDNWFSSLMG